METSVNLQDPFSYSIWPIVLMGVVLVFLTIMIVLIIVKRKKKGEDKKTELIQLVPVKRNEMNLKNEYLKKLKRKIRKEKKSYSKLRTNKNFKKFQKKSGPFSKT